MTETPAPTGLPDDDEPEPTPMGIDQDEKEPESGADAMPGIQEGEPDVSG